MTVEITEATEVTTQLVGAFDKLIPQLSQSSPPPTREELDALVSSPATTLLVATDRDNGQIVGSLTLVVFRIPTGVRAWIQDVVVDTEARGQGVGEALNRHAVALATDRGAKTVDLTSRPDRGTAHRLYQRLGFQIRDTSVYRRALKTE